MTFSRWWHLAVVGTAVVLSALVALDQPPLFRLLGAVAVNVLLVAAWFVLGRRAYANRGLAITLSAIVIALAGALMRGTGLLLLGGRLAGTWTRTIRARTVEIGVSPGTPTSASARRQLEVEAERFGRFVDRDAELVLAR